MKSFAFNQTTALIAACAFIFSQGLRGQPNLPQVSSDQSAVVYPASYFADFYPVSANDMLNRIPGIGLALRGGSSGRGLGAGEGEVLINGQRTTGKNNEGRDQLNRITADQVEYIEIIRGTSENMDIRSGGQVVNVVLIDNASRSSTTIETTTRQSGDGTFDSGGQISLSGQRTDIDYIVNLEADPGYRYWDSDEFTYDKDGNLIGAEKQDVSRDETEYSGNVNLGFNMSRSVLKLNGLFEQRGASPTDRERITADLVSGIVTEQSDQQSTTRRNWEIGGDYDYEIDSDSRFRVLFIVNDRKSTSDRIRYDVSNQELKPNLFLDQLSRDRERIIRTSLTRNVSEKQGLELGAEGAQTIRDSDLKMGLDTPGERDESYGNLVPVSIDNSKSTVQEIRYEPFMIHNWQINDRMSLETRLIYESSTIEQSGDVSRERSFSFVKPRIDYRYNLTQSFQVRFEVERDVSQLSFSDFSASVDSNDEEKNTFAGNPEIAQEKLWRYDLNLEYRLPNDLGVVNSEFYYRDAEDHIDRIDVSTSPDVLRSARGNIGDGKWYGVNFDISAKLDPLNIRNALFTTRLRIRDSEFTDPFLGVKRRREGNGRWGLNMGFRHDITSKRLTYGINYSNDSNDGEGRKQFDIDDIEERINQPSMSAYIEKRAFDNFTFRFESRNLTENQWCRSRTRFVGHIRDQQVREIEDYCSRSGIQLALRVRATF
ncbi:TonB-dependent receptor plug domain-containing protein [Gammaproteobacteria bacterium]|nr:TonB-dependent receptor plug domain-containing protein [Gammaproteobacteria bacterium]